MSGGVAYLHLSFSFFVPQSISVAVGDVVVWANQDPIASHIIAFNSTSKDFEPLLWGSSSSNSTTTNLQANLPYFQPSENNMGYSAGFLSSGVLNPGSNFTVCFTTAGSFHYIDPLHATQGMTGTVYVLDVNDFVMPTTPPPSPTPPLPTSSSSFVLPDQTTVVKSAAATESTTVVSFLLFFLMFALIV